MAQQAQTIRSYIHLAAILIGIAAAPSASWGQVLYEDLKLQPSDGQAGDLFGFSIAMNDQLIVVGALWDDAKGPRSGSVYLFDAATGAQITKLVAEDGSEGDYFGHSVAIENGMIVVGAPLDDDRGLDSGSVYLFDALTGNQIGEKLYADDGAAGDQFGVAVDVDDGVVVVSAHLDDVNGQYSGSAYLFDADTQRQLHKLLPHTGGAEAHFGRSLAIDSGLVAVGAYGENSWAGAVYLFEVSTGLQRFRLLPTDPNSLDYFGYSVDIASGCVVVGAFGNDDDGSQSGAAYVFDALTGVQGAKLLPDFGEDGDIFGHAVAIDHGVAVIGSRNDDDNGSDSGAAYLFKASTGEQVVKLLASDGAPGDWFGQPVAIDESRVAVGAYHNEDSGAVYLFPDGCRADLTGDGTVDTLDFLLFLGAFTSGDLIADWNRDGRVDTLDFLAYLTEWATGC
ncbi:MAG: hypothetical protein IT431_11100 [Phycisphaerales bacterium]|nr:hypothetical protein [Phycisphaerales bacterium]